MRLTPLHRDPDLYEKYYCSQHGNGLPSGIPVFMGSRSQKGRGLGSFFGGLGRMALPWLQTSGKALLREGLGTGMRVAQDALAGRNIGEAFRDRAKEAGQRLLQSAVEHMDTNQSGSGLRRQVRGSPPGEPLRKRVKLNHSHRRAHSVTKRAKYSDIFT